MSNFCVNIQHPDFQNLIKESNLNPLILKSKVGVWQEQNDTDRFPTLEEIGVKGNQVNYNLKAVDILLSDKAKEVFSKGEKNKWSLDKVLTELAIPKEQKKLLLDLNISDREDLALELTSRYGYSVEINTAKDTDISSQYIEEEGKYYRVDSEYGVKTEISKENYDLNYLASPTRHYSNLTVPGGTNYTENEISTPLITPSIKGHAQFSTDNGIGWFRSDEQYVTDKAYPQSFKDSYNGIWTKKEGIWYYEDSDRSIHKRDDLDDTDIYSIYDNQYGIKGYIQKGTNTKTRRILEIQSDLFQKGRDKKDLTKDSTYFEEGVGEMQSLEENEFDEKGNDFLQLLNKDSNWVTFFIKSIIQDSAKKGYEKVLFPKGETAAKIEGHETIADEIRKIDTKIKDLKNRFKIDFGVIETGKNEGMWYGYDKPYKNKQFAERSWTYAIEKLEQEKANLKSQGIEKLKPIEAFYEIKVGNILEKQFGKDNIKTITDEYGNEWREVDIKQERDLLSIGLGKPSFESPKSTPENPIIIPLTEHTEALYKHYNLLSADGKVKMFKTRKQFEEAQKWMRFNNEHAKYYSFALRKVGDNTYSIFIAQKFEDSDFSGKPIFTDPPIDNKSNFTAYYNYRRKLLEEVDRAYETFKTQNVANRDTPEYKETRRKFIEFQTRLAQELETSNEKVNDANIVFADIIYEIDVLDQIIKKKSPSEYANFKVEDRLETLITLFEGRNLRGEFVFAGVDEEGRPLSYVPINGEGYDNFVPIINKIQNLHREYEKTYEAVTRQIIESNPIHLANLERFKGDKVKMDEYMRSLEKLFNPQKDINILEEYLLGINSANDTASSAAINLYLQLELQKAQQSVFEKEQRVKDLDYKLHKSGFDFDNFFEKDSHGIDTGNIIHIYSKKWFKELSEFYDLKKKFREATRETGGKKAPYRDMMNWLKVRADIIDFTKLKYFKDIYGEIYGEHFTSTDDEMEAYENSLRERLGKHYEVTISEVENRLEEYQEARLTRETKGGEFTDLNIKQDSPWEFLKNYNSTRVYMPIAFTYKGEEKWTFAQPDHITFIPKRTFMTSMGETDTGFYNDNFKKIQENSDAYEYWSLVKDIYSKHINPAFSSKGQSIGTMSYGKFLRDSIEALRAKDGNPIVQKALNELWKRTSEVFQDNRKISTSEEQVVRSYTDKSKNLIKILKKYLEMLPTYDLEKMAWERNIQGFTGEGTSKSEEYRRELIDVLSRYDVLSMYSKDLTKITLALSAEASLHRARLETANIATLVKRYNEQIKTPNGKDRSKSVNKVNSWVEANVYNRRGADTMTQEEFNDKTTFGRILTDADKKIKKILLDLQSGTDRNGTSFEYKGETFSSNKDRYFVTVNVDENKKETSEIGKEDFESALGRMIEEELKKLGSPVTFNSLFNAILKSIVAKGLLINPKAGLFNRIEGTITNTIRDNEGSYWTTGNLAYAKKFMTGINLLRAFSNDRLTEEGVGHKAQVKTFIQVFEALGVYQDKKNELDRRDNMSRYRAIASKLDPYQWAVDLPEFKNQGEMVLCMLSDMTIKDIEGNEYNFFDKKSGTFPAFIPGTMQLKPEFRTAENLGWETFHLGDGTSNQFFVARVKIDDIIKRTQGNYSKLDSIKMQDSTIGRAAMLFLRWLPEHYQQRFMRRESDIIQGKPLSVGRYRALLSNAPALSIFATALTFTIAGPAFLTAFVGGGTIVMPFILKRLMKNKLEVDKNLALNNFNLKHTVAIMQEVLVQTLGFPLKMAHTTINVKPVDEVSIGRIYFKNITLNNLMSDENSGLNEAEARALKGMSQEIANILSVSLMLLAVKALFKSMLNKRDDDDEDNEVLDSLYYGISNMGDRLISTFTAWGNPNEFMEQNGKIAMLRACDDVIKLVKMISKATTEGGVDSGDLMYQVNKVQPVIPLPNSISSAVFKGQYPFFDIRDYTPGDWMDKMLKTSAERAKNDAVIQRKEFREDLEKEFEDMLRDYYRNQVENDPTSVMPKRDEIKEEAKTKANRVIRKTYNKKNETQEQTLARIRAMRDKYNKLSEE